MCWWFHRTVAVALTLVALGSSPWARGGVKFQTDVLPILTKHCVACHGPDDAARQAEFRIDRPQDAVADRGGYAGIAPGRPDESAVLRRITSDDAGERMPPPDAGDRLTDAEIAVLRAWIAEGASYDRHWAFEPIAAPHVPDARSAPEGATDIDRFIVAELERHGLGLSPQADRRTLIRRATYDLIGLPPTWEEVTAFVANDSPSAYAELIERLLASPHYGERWGRHWLDLARYADTHGAGALGAKAFPFAYTYRDYVIDAMNADLPYDRFVLEQIAADQIERHNDKGLAALGFLTVGRRPPNPHDIIDDRIDVVTRGLMGLTVACARCHDHKFDAIGTRDYYALYAVVSSSREPNSPPRIGAPVDSEAYRDFNRDLQRLEGARDDLVRDQLEAVRGRLRMEIGKYLGELAKGRPEQDLADAFFSFRTDDLRPQVIEAWRKYLAERTSEQDPVFGPWHKLKALAPEVFAQRSADILRSLRDENGDVTKLEKPYRIEAKIPRWNPRVLDALDERPLQSMVDVAHAYGRVFASVHEEWLQTILEASREAIPGAPQVADESPNHLRLNSPINRQLRRHLYAEGTPTALKDDRDWNLMNHILRDIALDLREEINDLNVKSPGSPPRAMVLEEIADPPVAHVFRRGNPLDRGAEVRPRFLEILAGPQAEPFPNGRRRLGLARAVIDPANPLTRRVLVNWVWQRHFGRGLVGTPDDFGVRGEPPTHPALLDYLASSLLKDGWSIKQLHRRIMLSLTYQQASGQPDVSDGNHGLALDHSAVDGNNTGKAPTQHAHGALGYSIDPRNTLLWRMPVRRLEFEAMRDAMLVVAGRLDMTPGGRPVDLTAHPFSPRRTVYGFVNRDVVPGLFSTFDMANPNACTARRPETIVPQQALFALNSHFVREQAAALAADSAGRGDRDRVGEMFRRAYARMPDPAEEERVLAFVASVPKHATPGPWEQLAQALLASSEFVFID